MFQMTALVAKYIFLALMMLFTGMGFYMYLKKPNSIVCRELFSYQTAIIVIFNILSFVIIILKEVHTAQTMETALEAGIITENAQMAGIKGIMLRFQQLTEKILPSWLRFSVVFTLLLYAGEMVFMYILLLTLHRHTNRLLWNCVFMLVSVGFVMLWRLDQTTASDAFLPGTLDMEHSCVAVSCGQRGPDCAALCFPLRDEWFSELGRPFRLYLPALGICQDHVRLLPGGALYQEPEALFRDGGGGGDRFYGPGAADPAGSGYAADFRNPGLAHDL